MNVSTESYKAASLKVQEVSAKEMKLPVCASISSEA